MHECHVLQKAKALVQLHPLNSWIEFLLVPMSFLESSFLLALLGMLSAGIQPEKRLGGCGMSWMPS